MTPQAISVTVINLEVQVASPTFSRRGTGGLAIVIPRDIRTGERQSDLAVIKGLYAITGCVDTPFLRITSCATATGVIVP